MLPRMRSKSDRMKSVEEVERPERQVVPRQEGSLLKVWLRDLVIAVGFSIFIVIFLYQPVRVEGVSMLPGLEDQERIFINKFVYRLEPIERGDVVVFHYPRDPSASYIKRVIAVPGDKISIREGQVRLNGYALPEPYVPWQFRDAKSMPEMIVPPGTYFVMGDHRSLSRDSREFGPVSQDLILGKAVMIYWPMDKFRVLR